MSTTTTLTMNSSIQRPSLRSPYAPPTAPLPALPVARTRTSKPLPDTPDASDSRPTTSGSGMSSAGSKTPTRSVTLSGIPTPRANKASSTPAVPTLNTTNLSDSGSVSTSASTTPASALPTPARTLRKTTSYGAFPVPPKGTPRTSLPPSPLSIATPSTENGPLGQGKSLRESSRHRTSDTGLKKPKARSSGYGSARGRQSVGSTTPSLLNGSGEGNFISSAAGARGSESLLSLPSPPQSRSSSANGSYQTDATQFEDVEDGAAAERGRPKSQETVTSKRNSKRQSDFKDSKGNVLVSVRVRPDAGGGDNSAPGGEWMVDGRRSLVSYKGKEEGDYRYDNVFSPHDNNGRVYDNAAKRLVRRVMEGYHGTVFAYGMTGTGKTFSMQGTAQQPGVIPLAITDIFSYIRENPNREFLLRVSYLEIYNEKIYDLLSQSTPGQAQQEEIKLREDSKRGVYATPLKEEIVQSPNQLLRVIARGDLARRTSSTQFNARSSRSHAVVQIVVESRKRTNSSGTYYEKEDRRTDRILPGGVLVSTLSLIDLAGSEKAAENKERRTEGAHINKSLLTLGTVIARLSGDDEKDKDGPADKRAADKGLKHLPYRDSKLTRLLQPALSGNSLVSILCTIQLSSAGSAAAGNSHTGETLNTLKFASRAKNNIVSHAKRNESSAQGGDAGSRALLDRYRIEIQDLRAQLEAQNMAKEEAERNEEIERDRRQEEELERAEKSRHEEQMLEMQLARTALKERISHLNRLILSSKSIGVNSGRFSSASASINRMSTLSANGDFGRPVSVRSRDSILSNGRCESAATLEVPMHKSRLSRTVSSGSMTMAVMPSANMSHIVTEDNFEDDEEGSGGDADGNASLQLQNQALQADLADKNRYIATLEKRLLQARRTSRSRVSMSLRHQEEEGGVEGVIRDKDQEIEELRARLDDQMRMVNVLRSELRRKNLVDNRKSGISGISEETARPGTASGGDRVSSRASSRSNRFTNASRSSHRSNPSNASRTSSGAINLGKSPLSPVTLLSPTISEDFEARENDDTVVSTNNADSTKPNTNAGTVTQAKQPQQPINRRKSVDEMTMLLDQMIQDKVDSGHVVRGERGSLRIKRDTVMEYKEKMSMEPGAEMVIEETDELD
ncbi:kinesin-domain-containing protein [Polychaeton citri CBS 116435]|uniref:Kinesin-like protein KIP2 n=1 Tax=Polychaeton citri CBS 116435 TaxID=1314669 RepID=A0A9P4QIQ5_9PEZI|nr:kinesin-domain-containing protein [Polychaeton citri CBS 116435]